MPFSLQVSSEGAPQAKPSVQNDWDTSSEPDFTLPGTNNLLCLIAKVIVVSSIMRNQIFGRIEKGCRGEGICFLRPGPSRRDPV